MNRAPETPNVSTELLHAPNMEKIKKFALHPATMFAAGAIAATAFAAVRKVAGYVAKFIPGASVPAE